MNIASRNWNKIIPLIESLVWGKTMATITKVVKTADKKKFVVKLDKNLQIFEILDIKTQQRPREAYEQLKGHPFNIDEILNVVSHEQVQ